MTILNQEKIVDNINKLTLDTFPRSLLLVGEKGSGKHLIVQYISYHLGLEVKDITSNISLETINDIYINPSPCIYLINGVELTDKKENVILKFLEEPLKNSFIIVLCEKKRQLLPTIVNRCIVWELEKYTLKSLRYFTEDDFLLKISDTPGQVKVFEKQNIEEVFNLCNLIIDKISNASYQNTLTLLNKLDFDKDGSKIDLLCFMKCMNYLLLERIKSNSSKVYLAAYIRTSKLLDDTYIHNINLVNLFSTYLTDMKLILQGKQSIRVD